MTAIAWLPAVPAERVPDAPAAIAAAGVEAPLAFGQNRRSLDVPNLGSVPHVILDIEPKDSASVLLG